MVDYLSLGVFLSHYVDKNGSAYNLSVQAVRSFPVVVQGPLQRKPLLEVLVVLVGDLTLYKGIIYQPSPTKSSTTNPYVPYFLDRHRSLGSLAEISSPRCLVYK